MKTFLAQTSSQPVLLPLHTSSQASVSNRFSTSSQPITMAYKRTDGYLAYLNGGIRPDSLMPDLQFNNVGGRTDSQPIRN